ncbi:MAG TPA: hypothetical protein VF251_04200 [Pyrinomonadaceae bacterium]
MSHAKNLRVIGQRLDLVKISLFEIEHDGEDYLVTSDAMARTAEWILRYATTEDFAPSQRAASKPRFQVKPVVFTKSDLSLLDRSEAKRRRDASQSEPQLKLPHLLRKLGDHLDANRARTFSISWTPNSVIVDFKKIGGLTDRLRFAPTKLADDVRGGGFSRALPQQ